VVDGPKQQCPHVSSCELFPLISRPGFLRVWQVHYCESDYGKCERYKRSLAGKAVPITLLPNGAELSGAPST
jgi:hypothetical protein